jgi:hypothetical protein
MKAQQAIARNGEAKSEAPIVNQKCLIGLRRVCQQKRLVEPPQTGATTYLIRKTIGAAAYHSEVPYLYQPAMVIAYMMLKTERCALSSIRACAELFLLSSLSKKEMKEGKSFSTKKLELINFFFFFIKLVRAKHKVHLYSILDEMQRHVN